MMRESMKPEADPSCRLELPPDHLLRPERGRGVAIVGLSLLAAATLMSTWVVAAVIAAFQQVAEAGGGAADGVAAGIAAVMWLNGASMVVSVAGGVLVAVALFGAGNRERWFFYLVAVLAALQLVTFPIGTPVGILLCFGLLIRHGEFRHDGVGEKVPTAPPPL